MRTGFVITLLLAGACGRGPEHDLAGTWSVCLTADSHSVCGVAHVAASSGAALRYSAWYPLTFDLDLDSVPGLVHPRTDHCGSMLVDEERGIAVELGIRCGNVTEADGGNLSAEFLQLRGDSLTGEWYQSCFSGCPARGAIAMVRERGSR